MRHYVECPYHEIAIKVPPLVKQAIMDEAYDKVIESVMSMRLGTDPDIAHVIVSDVVDVINELRSD